MRIHHQARLKKFNLLRKFAVVGAFVAAAIGGILGAHSLIARADATFSITPSIGLPDGGQTVDVSGYGFAGQSPVVKIGGQTCMNVVVHSDSDLTCTTPSSNLTTSHREGTVGVSVDVGGQVETVDGGFTYRALMSLLSVAPNLGSVAGGTAVTISGYNFIPLGGLSDPGAVTVTFDPDGDEAACVNARVVSNTEIDCTTSAHLSSGFVKVYVDVAHQQSVTSNAQVYAYSDVLNLSGATTVRPGQTYTYTLKFAANYTGTIGLSDGGKGGTFSSSSISFNNEKTKTFTYTPATGGAIQLSADATGIYIQDATLDLTGTATTYTVACNDGQIGNPNDPGATSGAAWSDAISYVNPASPLQCRIVLNGPFSGEISLQDLIGSTTNQLGGTFTSGDARWTNGKFVLTYANTATAASQTLPFYYTSISWSALQNLYHGNYEIYYPSLTPTIDPSDPTGTLTSTRGEAVAGLLAQQYWISQYSQTRRAIGVSQRYKVSTHSAPYFGKINILEDLSNSDNPNGTAGVFQNTPIQFDGTNADKVFWYAPNTTAEPPKYILLQGASSTPAIIDANLRINVYSSELNLVCTPSAGIRGSVSHCTLTANPAQWSQHETVSIGAIYASNSQNAGGTFTDTSAVGGTFADGKYTFTCDVADTSACTNGETYVRTFDYTTPLNPSSYVLDITAKQDSRGDTATAPYEILDDKLLLSCPQQNPGCANPMYVGIGSDVRLRPNGIWTGTAQMLDHGGSFSDGATGSWIGSDADKIFTFTPTTPGEYSISAKATASASDGNGIRVGDTVQLPVIVYADRFQITGPDQIGRHQTKTYTLTLNGPYVGYIDLKAVATNDPSRILDATIVNAETHSAKCFVTLDDYDATTNTSKCEFSVTPDETSYYMNIVGTPENATHAPQGTPKMVEIMADKVDLTCDQTQIDLGQTADCVAKPNGLYDDDVNLTDGGKGGTFNPNPVHFGQSDWPEPSDPNPTLEKPFTYTPAQADPQTPIDSHDDTGDPTGHTTIDVEDHTPPTNPPSNPGGTTPAQPAAPTPTAPNDNGAKVAIGAPSTGLLELLNNLPSEIWLGLGGLALVLALSGLISLKFLHRKNY
ncbi:MAG: IPT/TIG domain-containing protein [Candidatus Nomurabacteria bacterium]|jgi:hypothetical protein|nr:IPT/TIG domain-containing protein [Candidatus Nomurabacteria bacterium]